MYKAEENFVYYIHPINNTKELFLTVHKINDSSKTIIEQAVIIAEILNEED